MTTIFDGLLPVHYGQLYFEAGTHFDGDMEACFVGQQNGLCGAAQPGVLFVTTGLHTGDVGLSIHMHDRSPEIDEAWDDVVETSWRVTGPPIDLLEWGHDAGRPISMPAGHYRVRLSVSGMDAGRDADVNEGPEAIDRYRLDLWPAPPQQDLVLRQTSESAAYWNDWAQGLSGR